MTWSTPVGPPRSCAASSRPRISPPSTPSRWGGRWSTPISPRCHRTPGSISPGIPVLPSSRRSGVVANSLPVRSTEQPMSGSDDLSGEDPHLAQIVEEFERHSNELYERIADYMDETEIGEAYVAQLLLEAMIRMRMEAYAIDVEKP